MVFSTAILLKFGQLCSSPVGEPLDVQATPLRLWIESGVFCRQSDDPSDQIRQAPSKSKPIITAIQVPRPPQLRHFCSPKFARKSADEATILATHDESGKCAKSRKGVAWTHLEMHHRHDIYSNNGYQVRTMHLQWLASRGWLQIHRHASTSKTSVITSIQATQVSKDGDGLDVCKTAGAMQKLAVSNFTSFIEQAGLPYTRDMCVSLPQQVCDERYTTSRQINPLQIPCIKRRLATWSPGVCMATQHSKVVVVYELHATFSTSSGTSGI
eukprot:6214757-Pleurochrysis_carterae.AAC.1